MAALSDLLPLIGQHCPNAPTASMEFWARRAAREFCQRTLAHQATLASFDSVAGTDEYTLSCGTDLQPSKLLSVRFAGRALSLITPAELDAMPDLDETDGTPEAAYLSGTDKLTLYPSPAAVSAVAVRLALEPTVTAATIPDDLFKQYGQDIACGAVKYLALAPDGRDPALASAMATMFEQAIGMALARTYFARARSSRRVVPTWC